jgi:hypothetical protein
LRESAAASTRSPKNWSNATSQAVLLGIDLLLETLFLAGSSP